MCYSFINLSLCTITSEGNSYSIVLDASYPVEEALHVSHQILSVTVISTVELKCDRSHDTTEHYL